MTTEAVRPASPRADIELALADAVHHAKRQIPVSNPTGVLTKYDRAHEFINLLLDDMDAARD